MNWTVLLDPAVAQRVAAWGWRFPALPVLVQQRFQDELGTDPDSHLGPVIPPTSDRVYHMTFTGQPGVPDGLLCTFAVRVDRQARAVQVLAGRMQAPPANQP